MTARMIPCTDMSGRTIGFIPAQADVLQHERILTVLRLRTGPRFDPLCHYPGGPERLPETFHLVTIAIEREHHPNLWGRHVSYRVLEGERFLREIPGFAEIAAHGD
jgi:hypothetical protein